MDVEFPDLLGEFFVPSAWGPLRVMGLTRALLTPGFPNRVQACGVGSLEAQACIPARGLSLDLWVTWAQAGLGVSLPARPSASLRLPASRWSQ